MSEIVLDPVEISLIKRALLSAADHWRDIAAANDNGYYSQGAMDADALYTKLDQLPVPSYLHVQLQPIIQEES